MTNVRETIDALSAREHAEKEDILDAIVEFIVAHDLTDNAITALCHCIDDQRLGQDLIASLKPDNRNNATLGECKTRAATRQRVGGRSYDSRTRIASHFGIDANDVFEIFRQPIRNFPGR